MIMATHIALSGVGMSDVGKRYTHNEDRWFVDNDRGLFVVADGIGGAAAGEVAAGLVVDAFRMLKITDEDPGGSLRLGMVVANNEILRQVALNPSFKGMGVVATAVLLRKDVLYIAHVGDTRFYEITPTGRVIQHTQDHSPVGELEKAGKLTEFEAMSHPERNAVSRALGVNMVNSEGTGLVEVSQVRFNPKSLWLLCSDGLSDLVSKSEIVELLQLEGNTPTQHCKHLIERANMYGGKDNITVVLLLPIKIQSNKIPPSPPDLPSQPNPPNSEFKTLYQQLAGSSNDPREPVTPASTEHSHKKTAALWFIVGFLVGVMATLSLLFLLMQGGGLGLTK